MGISMLELLQQWDRDLFLWINSLHHPLLNSPMVILSGQVIWLPMILLSLWIAVKKFGWRMAGFFTLFLLLAIVASDVTSSYILKNTTLRLRPCREIDLRPLIYSFGQKCGGKYGFVSSHASNSFVLLTFTTFALRLKGLWWLVWILGGAVAYSRIYLGVHYPGDILGGVIVGCFWGGVMVWCFRRLKGQGEI